MVKIEMERVNGDFGFVAKDAAGHQISLDASEEAGGMNSGVRPMQSLLMALGACSAIDIVSILKKQKQTITGFKIKISGERSNEKPIALWKEINLIFELNGDIDPVKAEKACTLSIEKYCSVAETLRRAGANLTWKTIIQ